jgi:hypothetical protein
LSIYSPKLRTSLAIAEYLERGEQVDLLPEEKALVDKALANLNPRGQRE